MRAADRQQSAPMEVWEWNAQKDRSSKIFTLPRPISDYTLGFSVSPEGGSVLYSQIESRGSDLMMIDNYR
jgi:hypothetical protein